MAAATVKKALRKLQAEVRANDTDDMHSHRWANIPEDLQTEAARQLVIGARVVAAFDASAALLALDERFEYMSDKQIDAALWRFACQAALQRHADHVSGFIAEHAREPEEHTCFFPLENLTVPAKTELYGVSFLPAHEAVPPNTPWHMPAGASVVAVRCRGTGRSAMANRARARAEHALRLLRTTLRTHPGIHDRQLRFRLGEAHWIDDESSGWALHDDKAWEVDLHESFIAYATSPRVAALPFEPRNEVERRAHRALVWLEHSQLAVDPLVRTLSLFYALETMLGDEKGGKKGARLAVRRATLGAATTERFQHPIEVIVYYDKVRSAAVHGDEAMPLSDNDVAGLAWSVRDAVSEFLTYAETNGFTKRSQVVKSLRSNAHWDRIVDELLRPNPNWAEHVDDLA